MLYRYAFFLCLKNMKSSKNKKKRKIISVFAHFSGSWGEKHFLLVFQTTSSISSGRIPGCSQPSTCPLCTDQAPPTIQYWEKYVLKMELLPKSAFSYLIVTTTLPPGHVCPLQATQRRLNQQHGHILRCYCRNFFGVNQTFPMLCNAIGCPSSA